MTTDERIVKLEAQVAVLMEVMERMRMGLKLSEWCEDGFESRGFEGTLSVVLEELTNARDKLNNLNHKEAK